MAIPARDATLTDQDTGTGLAPALADRLNRIAWLIAHSHGVAPASIAQRPRFEPNATLARMVAIAVARDILQVPLETLGEFFHDTAEAMAAACNRVAERSERDCEFRTTVNFLTASCVSVLGLGGDTRAK